MNRLHDHADWLVCGGAFVVSLKHAARLGRGDATRGESVLHSMFKMAGARIVSASEVRRLGGGSITKGHKVLQEFLRRAGKPVAQQKRGGGAIAAEDRWSMSDLTPKGKRIFEQGTRDFGAGFPNEDHGFADGGVANHDPNTIWRPDNNHGRYEREGYESSKQRSRNRRPNFRDAIRPYTE
jgi:hypothetical protein